DVQEKILGQTMSDEEKKEEQAWLEGIKFELGSQFLKEGQYDRARKFFKTIVKTNSGFIPAHIGLANVILGEGKPHDAAEFLVRAFESTGSILLLHRLEDVYLELGEPEKVIRVFQDALQRNAGNPVLQFYLGKLFYRLEMVDEAFEVLNSLDPGDRKMPDLHKILGNLYLRKGDSENAVEEFKLALNLRKRVMIPYYCPPCDYHTNEWSGRCPRCKRWNSFSASPVMGDVHSRGTAAQ
ncbi:MAG TPA: tetratricopeptide repeat protein, partial [Nitrospiria bacterium]